jgi:type I restriction enzyme M protein
MANNHSELEKRLWEAADDLRANSKLKSAEYSVPVLGLIFLRYADRKFTEAEKKLAQQGSGRRKVGKPCFGRPFCAVSSSARVQCAQANPA